MYLCVYPTGHIISLQFLFHESLLCFFYKKKNIFPSLSFFKKNYHEYECSFVIALFSLFFCRYSVLEPQKMKFFKRKDLLRTKMYLFVGQVNFKTHRHISLCVRMHIRLFSSLSKNEGYSAKASPASDSLILFARATAFSDPRTDSE